MNDADQRSSETGLVELVRGDLRLLLNPSTGGSIWAFERIENDRVSPILRKCHSARENVLEASCFPLVPYVNRIKGGEFSFRGREVRLLPNMAGDPNPLHGQGWLNSWSVEETSKHRAVLTFDHRAGEWPWTYEARQEFDLDEGGLTIELSCRNTSDDPMPCGLGLHPYFPCGSATRIDTRVAFAWTIDAHVLPIEKVPAKGRFDLRDRAVCGQDLDHGFAGWDGEAKISDPDWTYHLRLSSPTAQFFQLYSPVEGGIFVAEPVSHANAALNAPEKEWPDLGMRVLDPGAEMRLRARLDVIPA